MHPLTEREKKATKIRIPKRQEKETYLGRVSNVSDKPMSIHSPFVDISTLMAIEYKHNASELNVT